MSYINLIMSFMYSFEVLPAFIVNFFEGQVSFGSLEYGAVGAPLSVSSEATRVSRKS